MPYKCMPYDIHIGKVCIHGLFIVYSKLHMNTNSVINEYFRQLHYSITVVVD